MKLQTIFVFMIMIIAATALGAAETIDADDDMVFKQNEDINFRFRCFNEQNDYCDSTTILLINIYAPNGTTIIDNSSLTSNPTFFNFTLPTDDVGKYGAIIHAPSETNTTTAFNYRVTELGSEFSNTLVLILLGLTLLLGGGLVVFGIWISDITITIIGDFLLYLIGIYIVIEGVATFDNFVTNGIATVILAIAFYVSVRASLEYFNQ